MYRVKKFIFRSTPSIETNSFTGSTQPMEVIGISGLSQWNCDGEVILDPDVTVKY